MKIQGPTKLYDSLLPMHFTAKLIALNPLKYNKKLETLGTSCYDIMYSVVGSIIFFGCFVYAVEDVRTVSDNSDTSISEATGWFELYAGIATQTSAIFLNCINAKKFEQFYHSLAKLDLKLSAMKAKVNYTASLTFVSTGIVAVFLEFFVVFYGDYVHFIKDESRMYLVTSYYPIISTGIAKLQWNTLIFLLWQRFARLNVILTNLKRRMLATPVKIIDLTLQLKRKADNSYAESINVVHDIHNELCDLSQLVNYLYGFQILITIGTGFTVCVNELYYVYSELKEPNEETIVLDIYLSIQWAALQIFELYVTLYLCDKTYREISKTAYHLHAFYHVDSNEELKTSIMFLVENKVDFSVAIKDLRFCSCVLLVITIRQFSLHMLHNDVKYTACGLFRLDYVFLHTMIGAITSYIIIMIQFDIAKNAIINTEVSLTDAD